MGKMRNKCTTIY